MPQPELHKLVSMGDLKRVLLHLEKNPNDVGVLDENGSSALHMAVHLRRVDIINALLEAGVDAHITSPVYGNALHLAAFLKSRTVYDLLVAQGLSPYEKGPRGLIPAKAFGDTKKATTRPPSIEIERKKEVVQDRQASDNGAKYTLADVIFENENIPPYGKNEVVFTLDDGAMHPGPKDSAASQAKYLLGRCPHCSARVKAKETAFHREMKCPKCKTLQTFRKI